MVNAKILDKYIKKFQNLNVDKNKNRYTVGKAPHKPILLLSLIVLYKNDRIDLENISLNIDLKETWSEFWNCLEYDKKGPIYLPFYHLKSDGFWNIDFKEGITPHQPRSLLSLKEMIENIKLNDDLIGLIQKKESRNILMNSIINGGYFSKDEKDNLSSSIEIIDSSFEYEEKLNNLVKEEFKIDHGSIEDKFGRSRDPAFRRMILNNYNETCAVCGLNIVTSSGISVIDAAHILPYHKFKNDDIRNGLALCKRHHWLFDQGLISVNEHYNILVSKSIEDENPNRVVRRYDGDKISLPESKRKYPSSVALKWHQHNIFL